MKRIKVEKISGLTGFVMLLFGLCFLTSLSSCASDTPPMPCPHFGLFCAKTPINSWSSEGYKND